MRIARGIWCQSPGAGSPARFRPASCLRCGLPLLGDACTYILFARRRGPPQTVRFKIGHTAQVTAGGVGTSAAAWCVSSAAPRMRHYTDILRHCKHNAFEFCVISVRAARHMGCYGRDLRRGQGSGAEDAARPNRRCPSARHGAGSCSSSPACGRRCFDMQSAGRAICSLLDSSGMTQSQVPTACSQYDFIWSVVMPLGAALCIIEVDLADLRRCLVRLHQHASKYAQQRC